ncbi:MAG: nonstructural protein [Arizlama microvirus]|nr:MAG: nonstructural protein [Arizlama microvirus]
MIKIYAIRDRLIDYFMQPFVGPDDKSVLASVARLVNNGEVTSDIAQAPHQFEVWTLGSVSEEGHLIPERGYLADCSSLVRGDIRKGPGQPRDTETATSEVGRGRPPSQLGGGTGADPSHLPAQAPATAGERPEAYKAASRGD